MEHDAAAAARARLERHPGVALTVNVDLFGDRPIKIATYRDWRDRHHAFKLFNEEDTT